VFSSNTARLCPGCYDIAFNRVRWNKEQVEFLRQHYPQHGANWVGKQLDIDPVKVRGKANKLYITLSQEATQRLVHDKARDYMLNHNPMWLPKVVEKVFATQSANGTRERNLQRLMAGHQKLRKTSVTKPQRKLYQAMQEAGIDFEPEYLIKPKFVVDAAIPKYMIILQVDGCYWHGHSCRFTNLTDRQKRQQARDRAQDKYLRTCGWTILRFWGCEINESINDCLLKITDSLSHTHIDQDIVSDHP